MKTRFLAITLVLGMGSAYAQSDLEELYGRADGLVSPVISPNGENIAAQCAPNGTPSICIFDIVNGAEPIYIGFNETQRLRGYYWVNNKTVVYTYGRVDTLQTRDGVDDYLFKRAIAFNLETQKSAALLSDEGAGNLDTSRVLAFLPAKDRKVLMSSPVRNMSRTQSRFTQTEVDEGNDWSWGYFEVDLKTGKSKKKKTLSPKTIQSVLRPDGSTLAELRVTDNNTRDDRRNYSVIANGKTIYETSKVRISDFDLIGYDAQTDGLVVFFNTHERNGLFSMSLKDGALSPIMIDGEAVGRADPIIDRYQQALVGFSYTNDLDVQVFIDPVLRAAQAKLQNVLKGQTILLLAWDTEKSKIVVSAESNGKPANYYVFNTKAGELGGLGSLASHIQPGMTGDVTAIEYAAQDGMVIPAYLTLPPGKTKGDGPFPLIVMPHGGPQARDTAGFDWWTQAYAATGYAVLQPNFRGSTGYGLGHQAAGFGEYGGKMVTDVTDGAAWAVEAGIAQPGGYCVAGASYGGYSAMMSAILDASHVKCAVSVNGVSEPLNWKSRFYDGGDSDNYIIRYLGADEFSQDRARSITPLARANELTAPILLLHGEEDMRVPVQQSKGMADALSGNPGAQFVELESADHFLQTTKARNAVLSHSLEFLRAHHPAE